jgi:hypothetical protein
MRPVSVLQQVAERTNQIVAVDTPYAHGLEKELFHATGFSRSNMELSRCLASGDARGTRRNDTEVRWEFIGILNPTLLLRHPVISREVSHVLS